jgi:glutamate formiminotransferase
MNPLVESVVNLSEGRDLDKIERFRRAVTGVEGCHLLDVHSDFDHNRSVFTLVGTPREILKGTFGLVTEAVEAIDLNFHQGVHPRIGSADVVPFIPLQDVSIRRCIQMAEEFCRLLAAKHGIPAYLYGLASRRPDRAELAQIRRGGFEALKTEGVLSGARRPDFGPDHVHPTAGATAVGVRHVLLAFNVLLERTEASQLRAIARQIRERDGGLPGVRALGLQLQSRQVSQISMNLVDYRKTSPLQALAAVRLAAGAFGLSVLGSELVGLAPRAALPGRPGDQLGLTATAGSRVLEERIREVAGLDISL